jgi:serine/threonine protein kinase
MDNLCKQLESKDIETIIIYVSQKNRFQVPITLQKSEEITAFIDFLSSSNTQNYVAKEFYNYFTREVNFHDEINSYEPISKVLTRENNIVGMPYRNTMLIGFEVKYKTNFLHMWDDKKYYVINRRCDQTMSSKIVRHFSVKTFETFIENILEIIVKINDINIAHRDIKLDNIMLCGNKGGNKGGNKYRLIDWEMGRKLNYKTITSNFTMGSCPAYYILSFGAMWETAYLKMIPHIIDLTGANDANSNSTSQYLLDGVEYYKKIFEEERSQERAFNKVKNGLDLFSFGAVLYGILQHNTEVKSSKKYEDYVNFVNDMYKETPRNAVKQFRKIK